MITIILQIVAAIIGVIKIWYNNQQSQEAVLQRKDDEIQKLRQAIYGMDVDLINRRLDRLLSAGGGTGGQHDPSDLQGQISRSTGASVLSRTGNIS